MNIGRMNMQDIKFKMIVLCLKPLRVFPVLSSEALWNFVAWLYKSLNSKCTLPHWWWDGLPLYSERFFWRHKIQRKMPLFQAMQKVRDLFLKNWKAVWFGHNIWTQIRRICTCVLVYVCWVLQVSLVGRQYGHQQGIFVCSAPSCSLVSGEKEKRREKGSPQLLATKD